MRVICYGDSNTYGFDPRSYFGGRYAADARWVDLLEEETGWKIQNEGENGRSIPRGAIRLPADTGLLIVMLGSNDLLQGADAETAADRLERFVRQLPLAKEQILLVAPPPMALGAWVAAPELVETSKRYAACCRSLADRLCIRFADAAAWNIELTFDGVHFTENGHRTFAARLYEFLQKGE